MNKTKRHLLLLMSILALLAIPTFVVFAKEMGNLTITGPGINGELSVSDPNFTLEKAGFFDQAVLARAPKGLDMEAGYSITAHLNLDGKIVPFAQMVYYATNEGQPGYIHYTARMQGDALQTVDEWNILSRSADNAFRDLMTANSVTLQSALIATTAKSGAPAAPAVSAAEPVAAAPVTSQAPMQASYLIPAAIAAVLLLIGAGFVLRRRTVSHTTT